MTVIMGRPAIVAVVKTLFHPVEWKKVLTLEPTDIREAQILTLELEAGFLEAKAGRIPPFLLVMTSLPTLLKKAYLQTKRPFAVNCARLDSRTARHLSRQTMHASFTRIDEAKHEP